MAFGPSTISDIGGAASDLFAASGDKSKAQYDFAEGQQYGLASDLATENETFTETSTAIKQAQQSREATSAIGGVQADVAGAGFAESGSALDILRDSASQSALTRAVAGQQGLITEAGYKEQAQSDTIMQNAAIQAGNAENQASTFADISAGIKGIAAVASIVAAPATGGASLAGLSAFASMGGGAAPPTDL